MVMAAQAVKAGMADRVATFDETVARLARGEAPAAKPRALADAVAAEKNAADDPRQNDPEGGTPSTLDHVADAERLLAYDAVREAFPTRA